MLLRKDILNTLENKRIPVDIHKMHYYHFIHAVCIASYGDQLEYATKSKLQSMPTRGNTFPISMYYCFNHASKPSFYIYKCDPLANAPPIC